MQITPYSFSCLHSYDYHPCPHVTIRPPFISLFSTFIFSCTITLFPFIQFPYYDFLNIIPYMQHVTAVLQTRHAIAIHLAEALV